jgi:DNA-binding XRE family transcriptional regulator
LATEKIRALNIWFERGKIFIELQDGREVGVPLSHYPRLAHAGPEDLADWEMDDSGTSIHWPRLDEDLTVSGLLAGRRSVQPSRKVIEQLAPRVLAARMAAGLTQKALAEQMGYSQAYVSLAERGQTPFGTFYLDQVLKVCGKPAP